MVLTGYSSPIPRRLFYAGICVGAPVPGIWDIEGFMKIEALQKFWVRARNTYRASFAKIVDEEIEACKSEE
jgi:hypothetical protein